MTQWTDRAWWTVEDASALLRVDRKTLYYACNSGDFPAKRVGPYWRIPAEALRLTPLPATQSRNWHTDDQPGQLVLDLDPACLIPVRRYRNTRERIPVVAPWGA